MKSNLIPATFVALLITGTAALAADSKPAKVTFADADTDHDGKVSLREYTTAHKATMEASAAKAKFTELDKDKDGKLTREEFMAKQKDPEQAAKNFVKFDKDKSGDLSKEEFVKMGK